MAKFELVKCLVLKVGQNKRMCNCVYSQILEGYPRTGGGGGWGEGCEMV